MPEPEALPLPDPDALPDALPEPDPVPELEDEPSLREDFSLDVEPEPAALPDELPDDMLPVAAPPLELSPPPRLELEALQPPIANAPTTSGTTSNFLSIVSPPRKVCSLIVEAGGVRVNPVRNRREVKKVF